MNNPPVVLPPNKQWSQLNDGSLFGSLYGTRNISLDKRGLLRLSKRMRYVGRVNQGSNFEEVTSIVFDGAGLANSTSQYYIINAGTIYTLSEDLATFAVDGTAGTPSVTLNSDGVLWNDGLYVTVSANLAKLVGGTWTGTLMTLTSNIPHPLCVSAVNNNLLVGNGNKLEQRTAAGVNTTALTLPSNFRIMWIRSGTDRTFIGCMALDGGSTAVFDWDETSAGANNRFSVDCNTVLSGAFMASDFYIVTDDGRLMRFDGGGFITAAQFPVYKSLNSSWVSINGYSMAQRGMAVIGGKLTMNINGLLQVDTAAFTYEARDIFSSGIWEYDGEATLNHKYGLSNATAGASTDFDYIVVESEMPGAISAIYKDVKLGYTPSPAVGQILLAGGSLSDVTEMGTTQYVLCAVTTGDNRGIFTTQRVETVQITNTANKLWVKFAGVESAADKILFKYRTSERLNFPLSVGAGGTENANWTSNTTFTITAAAAPNWQYVLVGDEVTITNGNGAGSTAHVVSSVLNAGTYTVTLDEAITNVSNGDETGLIVDNWVKIETSITNADILGYKDIPIPQTTPSTWIQIKGEMRGSDVVIEELQLVESTQQIASS